MVKLRHNEPAHHPVKKKEDGKSRYFLSFTKFLSSYSNDSVAYQSSMSSQVQSSEEAIHSTTSLNVSNAGGDLNASIPVTNGNANQGSYAKAAPSISYSSTNSNHFGKILNEVNESAHWERPESSLIQVALAFHRWRYSHLKNIFTAQMRKFVKVAHKDEAYVVSLPLRKEAPSKEEKLLPARAAQLHAYQAQSFDQVDRSLHMELLEALERAQTAEAMVAEKNIEISRLRQELDMLKNENIMKLRADTSLLVENKYNNSCDEPQLLLEQRPSEDQQVPGKKDSLVIHLRGQRRSGLALQQHKGREQSKSCKAASKELEEHLKRLTLYVQNLEACLQKRGQNGGNNFHQSITNFVADTPMEPVTMCFEASDPTHIANPNDRHRNKALSTTNVKKHSYYFRGDLEVEMPRDITQKSKQSPYLHQNQKIISWSQSHSQERITAVTTHDTPKKFTNLLSRCISWKWRWAAAAAQLKALSKELQNTTLAKGSEAIGALTTTSHPSAINREKFITSMQKLGFIHVQNLHSPLHHPKKGRSVAAKLKQKEAKFSVPGYKVVSIMLSMWRASIKNAKLEQEAMCNGEKLSRLLSGLPWLIQRFEERRHLERMFYHWVLHMMRAKIEVYHMAVHHSSSWSCWPKRPPSSMWVTQLGLPDPRLLEGNGYQGRYMRSVHAKPNNEKPLPPAAETRKGYSKGPERGDVGLTHQQECLEQTLGVLDTEAGEGFPASELVCSDQILLLNRLRPCLSHGEGLAALSESSCLSDNVSVDQVDNGIGPTNWNKKCNVTSFTERAMQAFQVSLYNELQKLQDLIVKEAQIHQQKVGEKEKGISLEDPESNASPFSTSLCRICNGLAHCLIEARNQILALAGNSAEDPSDMPPAMAAKENHQSHPAQMTKACDKLYEKRRFRLVKFESRFKKAKDSYANGEDNAKVRESPTILEFVGGAKVRGRMAHEEKPVNAANSLGPRKLSELGTRYSTLMESKTHLHLVK